MVEERNAGVLSIAERTTERDVWTLQPEGGEPRPFLDSRFNERGATFSPDGRWLAYASDASGADQVYVRAYPGPGPQIPVSTDGGVEPAWSRAGSEIFYRQNDRMMSASFSPVPTPTIGRPQLVFERQYRTSALGVANYDVAFDGRFIMIRSGKSGSDTATLTVVQNWFADLKRLVPSSVNQR